MTVREAQVWGAGRLGEVAELRESSARDAALLLRCVLGVGPAGLLAWPERSLTAEQQTAYEAAVARRMLCEPVQYITGEQEFYGLALRVTRAVLIPRPETEVLVETVLDALRGRGAVRVVDVGTGSGAIAIVLAGELPEAEVEAVDVSASALEVARGNAERHGVSGRVRMVQSDLMEGLDGVGVYDAVVANPPYVPEGDRKGMHRQVWEWEPAEALFAGGDGLGVYRRLVPAAWNGLRPGGLLAMELGFGQSEAVAELLRGWDGVRFVDDLQGIRRVVVARRGAGLD
ncbi:MAG: peptide chain release factor N(5)-glutamine methyltransferase [Acidobacteriota bacterium]|nr:peptide chain release factor N(5)-glutamine methyltransferase [Acidobacteriota bacterium]